ncbi:MAG TPA: hypothetical protein VGX03_20250 [Candidatus Binatia bacterium]|nr:hypothetical protein [Candidatus Binatia bacterium]
MKTRTLNVMFLVAPWLVAGIVTAFAPQARADHVVHLTFKKALAVPGVFGEWKGIVEGDITGGLRTVLLNSHQSGAILEVGFDWIIDADDPARSFTARLTGTLNTETGKAVMDGAVTDGYLKGAPVHEEGQLVNPDPQVLGFKGVIRIKVKPVRLTFAKELAEPGVFGVWKGTVAGDITGNLTTVLRDANQLGALLLVRFDWIIDAGDRSFVARLTGTLNTATGKVAMNGVVAEGYLKGARVHEEGQLVNPDPQVLGFEGTIRLLPRARPFAFLERP